jgi:peptidoglycan hydrolase CwlO-like protein
MFSGFKIKISVFALSLFLAYSVWFGIKLIEKQDASIKLCQQASVDNKKEIVKLNGKIDNLNKDVSELKRKCKVLCKDAAAAWLNDGK